MNKLKNIIVFLFAVLTLLSTANIYASNFVCAQDLDGNGDVTGIGENASCQAIGAEQFCSVGAQTCIANTAIKYKCSINTQKYNSLNSCKDECEVVPPTNAKISYTTWVYANGSKGLRSIRARNLRANSTGSIGKSWNYYFNHPSAILTSFERAGILYTRGSLESTSTPVAQVYFPGDYTYTEYYKLNAILANGVINGSCSTTESNPVFTCPVPGNSCVDVGGIQKCSINTCIDLDADDTVTEASPDLNPPNIDDGNRDVDGTCTEMALIFDGKGMRCRYKGFGGLADNCCKSSGEVLSDSTGSYVTKMVTNVAMSATWEVLRAGYAGFTEAYAFFGDVEMASAGAEVAAQGALESFAIDPTTLAISLAIHVFIDMMACEQSEQEAAIYKGSGYCHEIGSFCSKKIKFLGCVERSKGMCCFNSKLARILQEQGRVQLGKDWGSAESPSCGGFTPNEFQSLDFSRIDLTEYYGDIKSKGDSLIQKNIIDGVTDYYKQIKK